MRSNVHRTSQNPARRATGFTIIEFLIALTTLGIVASYGIPALASLVSSQRITSNERVLIANMKYAQSEAVKRNRPVTICVTDTPTSCDADIAAEWNQGWLVFTDDNADGVIDLPAIPGAPGEEILRDQSGITKMTFYFPGNQKNLTFLGAGQVSSGGDVNVRFCE